MIHKNIDTCMQISLNYAGTMKFNYNLCISNVASKSVSKGVCIHLVYYTVSLCIRSQSLDNHSIYMDIQQNFKQSQSLDTTDKFVK